MNSSASTWIPPSCSATTRPTRARPAECHGYPAQQAQLRSSAAAPDSLRQQPGPAALETPPYQRRVCCHLVWRAAPKLANPPHTLRCLTCRRRKTRCAGEQPICTTCTKNGHQCLGYPDAPYQAKQPEDDDGPLVEDEDDQDKKPPSNGLDAAPPPSTAPQPAPPPQPGAPAKPEPDVDGSRPSPPSSRHRSLPDEALASPTLRRNHNHRIPYFRYFGPTAIVPGFKQMVVSVRDRRRSTGASQSVGSPSPSQAASAAAAAPPAATSLPRTCPPMTPAARTPSIPSPLASSRPSSCTSAATIPSSSRPSSRASSGRSVSSPSSSMPSAPSLLASPTPRL